MMAGALKDRLQPITVRIPQVNMRILLGTWLVFYNNIDYICKNNEKTYARIWAGTKSVHHIRQNC